MDKLTSQISTLFYIHGLNAHKDKQFHRLKMTLNKSAPDRGPEASEESLRLSGGDAESKERRTVSSICVFSPTMAAK